MAYVLSAVTTLPDGNDASGGGVKHQWLALAPRRQSQERQNTTPPPLLDLAGHRLVLASPPEAHEPRLRNPLVETRGAIVLIRRGTCSFTDKVRRALTAGGAAVIVGNNDKAHPHAVFAMPGAWDEPSGLDQQESLRIWMVSYACFEQLCALVRLEADFADGGAAGSQRPPVLLQTSISPLRDGAKLRRWELGAAIRALILCNDHEMLHALLRHVDATYVVCGDDNSGEDDDFNNNHHTSSNNKSAPPLLPYNETEPETGNTPLHIAVEQDAFQCLGHLLQCRGISPSLDQPRLDSYRPTHLAARQDHDLCLSMLVCAGAYIDAPHRLGWTPLHFAAQSGSLQTLQILIQADAALDARALDGSTPLLIAVLSGQAPVVSALLTAGANLYLPNHQGKLPADFAGVGMDAKGGCLRVIEQYQEQGETAGTFDLTSSACHGTPMDHFYHWAAAPWLSVSRPVSSSSSSSFSLKQRKAPSPLPPEAPVLEVVSFLRETVDHESTYHSSNRSSSSSGSSSSYHDLPICRAVLPWDAVHAALQARRNSSSNSSSSSSSSSSKKKQTDTGRQKEEITELQEELAAFLAEDEDEDEDEEESLTDDRGGDKGGAGQRILGLIAQGLRPAVSSLRGNPTSGALPRLADRGRLVALELPASFRMGLWVAILSPSDTDGEKGVVRDADIKPTHSAVIEGRVQCLYEDLRRTKFLEYAQGEGMARLRRLILAWLHLREENGYRQGLTSLASVFLEVFPSRWPQRWDHVADRQALQCLSRVVTLHMDGLFTHGSSLERLQDRVRYVESMLLYWDPLVALHLAGMEVPGELFCTPWLVTLFADVLPMEAVVAVLDVLLTLGPSFCLCFAAAIVLQWRDVILATTSQTTLLLTFSRLNSEVQPIDVPACLDRAFHLYAKTPGGLLRPWDQHQHQQHQHQQYQQQQGRPPLHKTSPQPLPAWKEKSHDAEKEDNNSSNGGNGLPRRASFLTLPHVLDHVARLSSQDLQELEEAFREEEEEEQADEEGGDENDKRHCSKAKKADEEERKKGVVLIDVREMTMDEYYGEKPLRGVPVGIRRVRLPFSTVRGHVDFCRPLRSVQKEMRPPAALRSFIGRAHIVVLGGEGGRGGRGGGGRRAEDVARMLVLCKVPLVSVLVSEKNDDGDVAVASIA